MNQRRRRIAFATGAEEPISSINIVPLIDVLLVLLIMFIITLPIMTHSVKINLPPDGPTQVEPEIHRLDLDSASRLSWDGASIAETALPARLAAFRAASPDGILHFRAAPETRYEDFDRVLANVKRARIERLAFLGNERFARAY
jgi:biopolymer transport protein ExbD